MHEIPPVLVRVRPGCVIHRNGRPWTAGEKVHLLPDDAARLADHGTVDLIER